MKRELLIFTAKVFIVLVFIVLGLFTATRMGILNSYNYSENGRYSLQTDRSSMGVFDTQTGDFYLMGISYDEPLQAGKAFVIKSD